jgi:hypothetical protein
MGETPAGCRLGTGALGCSAYAVLLGVGAIGLGAVLFTGGLPSSDAGTGAGVAAGRLTVLAAMAWSIREDHLPERVRWPNVAQPLTTTAIHKIPKIHPPMTSLTQCTPR